MSNLTITYAGETWTPSTNADFGLRLKWIDGATQFRTESGRLRSINPPWSGYRELTVTFSFLTAEDRAGLAALLRAVGTREDITVSVYPDDPDADLVADYSITGRIVGANDSSHRIVRLWSDRLTIQETQPYDPGSF